MQINNRLETESLRYTANKPNMLERNFEIENLANVHAYCNEIEEPLEINEDMWSIEVEEGICLSEWIFSSAGQGNSDDRTFFLQLMTKRNKNIREGDRVISVSLGEYENSVHDVEGYVKHRRDILKEISSPIEFAEFMPSCFMNSLFADKIVNEMKKINDFKYHTNEIVESLAVLNDEAILLYEEHRDNLKVAMDKLSTKLRKCSPDPNHLKFLKFKFCYKEVIDGNTVAKNKEIVCSPHLKLIHKGSNLRIYFWWKDDEIEKGEKVLIGRIGGHPY